MISADERHFVRIAGCATLQELFDLHKLLLCGTLKLLRHKLDDILNGV